MAGKPRGRPRAYDPDTALADIRDAFWTAGFAATSLDQLAAATGMNRPSLYAAFGDKQAMYLRAIELFAADMRQRVEQALAAPTLADALARFYASAIDLYLEGPSGPRGCLALCTATAEALGDPAIRAALAAVIDDLDAALAGRVAQAVETGELRTDAEPARLARLAASVLHSLAVRARAGARRETLTTLAADGVRLICGISPLRMGASDPVPLSGLPCHATRPTGLA